MRMPAQRGIVGCRWCNASRERLVRGRRRLGAGCQPRRGAQMARPPCGSRRGRPGGPILATASHPVRAGLRHIRTRPYTPRPMARRSASSRPVCANGHRSHPSTPQPIAPPPCRHGSATTTAANLTRLSPESLPSAESPATTSLAARTRAVSIHFDRNGLQRPAARSTRRDRRDARGLNLIPQPGTCRHSLYGGNGSAGCPGIARRRRPEVANQDHAHSRRVFHAQPHTFAVPDLSDDRVPRARRTGC